MAMPWSATQTHYGSLAPSPCRFEIRVQKAGRRIEILSKLCILLAAMQNQTQCLCGCRALARTRISSSTSGAEEAAKLRMRAALLEQARELNSRLDSLLRQRDECEPHDRAQLQDRIDGVAKQLEDLRRRYNDTLS